MSLYVIGDVQGCFGSLNFLLNKINFNSQQDELIFVGDLVNRGSQSLAVLEWLMTTNASVRSVLGNHDLHLLACMMRARSSSPSDTLQSILTSQKRNELQNWLRQQPLALTFTYQEKEYFVSHAGLLPIWTPHQALLRAKEVEHVLQGENCAGFLKEMYGNQPAQWHDGLTGMTRLRVITNALTRMRFCNVQGELELNTKENANHAPAGFLPWYQHARQAPDTTLIYGHWAAQGLVLEDNLVGLDTGCVWGGQLTAVRLDDRAVFQVERCDEDIATAIC